MYLNFFIVVKTSINNLSEAINIHPPFQGLREVAPNLAVILRLTFLRKAFLPVFSADSLNKSQVAGIFPAYSYH